MKYVMTEAVAPEGMALLDQSEKVYVAHDANPANYTEEMKDADALIVRAAPAKIVNKAVMEAAPRLKVIGRTGVGYDSVDVDAATELGIPVVITPGANNRAVAEHSLTLMLALSKTLLRHRLRLPRATGQSVMHISSLSFTERKPESSDLAVSAVTLHLFALVLV